MNLGWQGAVLSTGATALVCVLSVVWTSGQTRPEQKPQMAEDVFKNVQVLRGLSVDEFMNTMGFFSAALGMNCVDCHTAESVGNWVKFADDTPIKQTARRMVAMVKAINQANFDGARKITCYSCHRGGDHPEITPSLAEQYGTPLPGTRTRLKISESFLRRTLPIKSSTGTSRRSAERSNWPSSPVSQPGELMPATTPIPRKSR